MGQISNSNWQGTGKLALAAFVICALAISASAKKKDSPDARAEYLARVQQQQTPTPLETTTGSLWVPGGSLTDLSADYKARHVNDTIIIQVVQQTTASATGDTSTQRDNTASSSITGLPGRVNTGGLNPLLGAQSSTALKGTGATSSTTKVQTSLAGQVIAVLPNGNLVVEAQREVLLNHEKETAIVRGVVRPGDVGPNNAVLSTFLANLEIELKGKGVISDATRPPSLVMKILTRLLTF
jgi:flagellar L-ring protein precursor FlgH